jgi:hypothetical protein
MPELAIFKGSCCDSWNTQIVASIVIGKQLAYFLRLVNVHYSCLVPFKTDVSQVESTSQLSNRTSEKYNIVIKRYLLYIEFDCGFPKK